MFRFKTSLLMLALTGVMTGCGASHIPVSLVGSSPLFQSCRSLVDGSGLPSAEELRWHDVPAGPGRRSIDQSCTTVGPGVYQAVSRADRPVSSLAIVSWNMH